MATTAPTTHDLAYGDTWARDHAGVWRCGDLLVGLLDGDPLRFVLKASPGYTAEGLDRQPYTVLEDLFPLTGTAQRGDTTAIGDGYRWLEGIIATRFAERDLPEPPFGGLEAWYLAAEPTVWEAFHEAAEDVTEADDLDAEVLAVEPMRLDPIALARVMREGPRRPEMLIDDWLVRGQLHWIYTEPQGAKTMLSLWLVVQLLDRGETVVWVDEEMGREDIADRLRGLGATEEAVERHLVYLEFPALSRDREDVRAWRELLDQHRPTLVVFDAASDVLAAADLNEDKGLDVTAWIKTFCEPVRQLGGTVVVIDHVPKAGASGGYAVGSRAKRAKAKVMYELTTIKPFDRETIGLVKVECVKDGIASGVPKDRRIEIGGDAQGGIVVREVPIPITEGADKSDQLMRIRNKIIEVVREHGRDGTRLTSNQLVELVSGRTADVRNQAKELATSQHTGVRSQPGARNSVEYFWEDPVLVEGASS